LSNFRNDPTNSKDQASAVVRRLKYHRLFLLGLWIVQ
jgi:hypothetical protein